MSKTTVSKALSQLDRDSLKGLILELYAARREARDWLEFWAEPDIEKEYKKAIERISKLHFLPSKKPRAKVAASDISAVLKNFKSLCPDPERIGYLMLTTGELMYNWLVARRGKGMNAYRSRLDTMTAGIQEHIDAYDLGNMMSERLKRLNEYIESYYRDFEEPPRRRRRGWW